jgi:thiosulfate/3-mercaptopyruvate sulfurtransferase
VSVEIPAADVKTILLLAIKHDVSVTPSPGMLSRFKPKPKFPFSPALLSPLRSYELASTMKDQVVFVDASWHLNKERNDRRLEEHCSNRLPGSVFFDIDDICDQNTTLPHMLPTPEIFAQKMGQLGISNSTMVILYNTANSFSAPRVWWTLRAFRHPLVSVLDGGLDAWITAGFPTETGLANRNECVYATNGFNHRMVASLDDVQSVVRTGLSQICDVRPTERFNGAAPEPRSGLERGHIPGSLNIPSRMFLEDHDPTTFKSPKEIDQIFQQHGIIRNARVVFSCGSGVTAALAAFARSVSGVNEEMSPVYDGSWTEWGSRGDTPKSKS